MIRSERLRIVKISDVERQLQHDRRAINGQLIANTDAARGRDRWDRNMALGIGLAVIGVNHLSRYFSENIQRRVRPLSKVVGIAAFTFAGVRHLDSVGKSEDLKRLVASISSPFNQ
jgi:hypothetical protein